MDTIAYKARAKINLGLDVLWRLENGYHEVKMIMQTIDLYDELEFKRTDTPDISLKTDSRYELGGILDNLAYKAAKLMKERYAISGGIEISLKKNIPVAAGMAGGSADAAATMLAVNELFGLGRSRTELMEAALSLGADIPFCIMGGTALAEGIGEKLTPLPAPPRAALVVAKPDIMVSTGEVYKRLDLGGVKRHPDIGGMTEAIRGGDIGGIAQRMENVLETVTETVFPVIADIKKTLRENGALGAMMSGSGPAVFGIFTDKEEAEAAAQHVKGMLCQKGKEAQIYVTSFYNGD